MHHIKARLFGVVLIVLGVALVYLNWRELWTDGTYSMKIATFGPVVGMGGLFCSYFRRAPESPTPPAKKSQSC